MKKIAKTPSKKLTALPPGDVAADEQRAKKAPGVPGLQVTKHLGTPRQHAKAPRPAAVELTGRDLSSAPGWSAGANDLCEILSQGIKRGSR